MKILEQQKFILILLAKGLIVLITQWIIWTYRFLSISEHNGNKRKFRLYECWPQLKMTKIPLTLIIITFSFLRKGQNVPDFESNTTEKDKEESLILDEFQDKYEIIISHTKTCYWTSVQRYIILGFNDGQWEIFHWTITFQDRIKTKENIKKTKRKRIRIEKEKIDSVLNYLTCTEFWLLRNDSLNINTKQLNDTVINDTIFKVSAIISLTDGCHDKFECISKNKYRSIYSYEADYFQQEIPIRQRQKFILCRNVYLKLLGSK